MKDANQKEGLPVPAKVYLVGAGPGDPALLTLRAVEVLAECNVVLYDRLIDKAILKHASQAVLIPVGKKAGQKRGAQRQERITRLVVRYSYAGFKVVRLKGGDPFIFGRGGEELMALAAARIPFEVVPGVSSFYAAPGVVGIPVTHRGLAASFGVFTAHEAAKGEGVGIDWKTAAQIHTAIFLMGLSNLPKIVKNLIEHGRDPETPVAVISRASFPDQSLSIGTLSNIQKRSQGLPSPATVLVGEVVKLRENILGLHSEKHYAKEHYAKEEYAEEDLELAWRGEIAGGRI